MASKSRVIRRPAKDEWGVYDPEQAGLAALYARLEKKEVKAAVKPEAPSPAPAAPAPAAKPDRKEPPGRPTLRDAQ